ncbi:hypothetical protein PVL29_015845 [Vitis rotundifolia]|uniref:Vacuolar iron transporter n=1 Tax=Vitis rotundifolia TaxID=103349 RepID=A0AA38ZF08_VITRO|nr:hypothetical protein PVL29_015845 [Vitis rotundifolia]
MAALNPACKNVEISVHEDNLLPHGQPQDPKAQHFHSSNRGQWLRAAILGANNGLVSVASLMMGVGALKRDVMAMALAGFAGLVAGSCSVAIGEYVSIYTQLDIEATHMRRNSREDSKNLELPNPFQVAIASALTFVVGAMVPVVAAAITRDHKVRLGVVVAVSTLAFLVFGGVGAFLGRTPAGWSCARVLVGGWMAMAVTSGLTMLIGSSH